jgi:hypothetical protein
MFEMRPAPRSAEVIADTDAAVSMVVSERLVAVTTTSCSAESSVAPDWAFAAITAHTPARPKTMRARPLPRTPLGRNTRLFFIGIPLFASKPKRKYLWFTLIY